MSVSITRGRFPPLRCIDLGKDVRDGKQGPHVPRRSPRSYRARGVAALRDAASRGADAAGACEPAVRERCGRIEVSFLRCGPSAPNPKFAHVVLQERLRTSGSKGGTGIIELLVSL
jgi:hypothetical protein